jgi:hypothetical protein
VQRDRADGAPPYHERFPVSYLVDHHAVCI